MEKERDTMIGRRLERDSETPGTKMPPMSSSLFLPKELLRLAMAVASIHAGYIHPKNGGL